MITKRHFLKKWFITILAVISFVSFSPWIFGGMTSVKDFQIPAMLINKRIGVVEFEPLPNDYPAGFKPLELSISGELFACKNSKERIFIPKNYRNDIQDVMTLALGEKNAPVSKYRSLEQALHDGSEIVLWGIVKGYKVSSNNTEGSSFRAEVKLYITMLDGVTENTLWEGDISSTASLFETNSESPRETTSMKDRGGFSTDTISPMVSKFHNSGLDILVIDEEKVFHPLRVLLSVATYNAVPILMERINQICNKN